MELRPLSFGEIFDRAITLYIRNFIPFAGIVLVLIVPFSVVQYMLDVLEQPQLDAMFKMIQHPGHVPSQPIPTAFDSPVAAAVIVISLVVAYVLWPFALNAVAVGVARLYRNKPVAFRPCYEAVFRRWLPILAVLGIEIGILLAWYVATVLTIVLLVIIASVVAVAWGPLGFIGAVLAIVVGLTAFLTIAPLLIALTFSLYGVVIEERAAGAAVASGFARVFNAKEFWRATLFSIAVGAVVFAASAMVGALALVAGTLHWTVLEVIAESLARAVFTPFAAVLIAIYYFDVRIRREGFDLEAGLERLAAGNQSP